MVTRAHERANWIDLDAGETAPPEAIWQVNDSIRLTYTVDLKASRPYRHLQIATGVDARLRVDEVRSYQAKILEGLEDWIRLFYPMHSTLRIAWDVGTPRIRKTGDSQAWRTPVVAHIWADWHDPGAQPAPSVRAGADYQARAIALRELAEQPARWRQVGPDLGELPSDQKIRLKESDWATQIVVAYSIDVIDAPELGSADRLGQYRHLSIQWSVPGSIDSAQLDAMDPDDRRELLRAFFELARPFWPLTLEVETRLQVGEAVWVRSTREGLGPGGRYAAPIAQRTPITVHFIVAAL